MTERLDAAAFFAELFPSLGGGVCVEIRVIAGGKVIARRWPASAAEIITVAGEFKDVGDVYFGPAARRGHNGRKAGVAYTRALWCDVDAAPGEAHAVLAAFPFPPTAIVSSGHGVHVYWLLREPYEVNTPADIDYIEGCQRGLAERLGGDACWDIGHVLRVPGTINHKNGEAQPVELIEYRAGLRCNASDFEDWAVPAPPPSTTVAVDFSGAVDDADDILLKCIRAGTSPETVEMVTAPMPKGQRSQRDMAVIARVLRDDPALTDGELRALFRGYPEGLGAKYHERGEGDRYLKRTIARARASLAEEPDPTTGLRSWEARAYISDAQDNPDGGSQAAGTVIKNGVRAGDTVNIAAQPPIAGPRLPELAWLPPFDVYRRAVGGSTEAADEHHFGAFRVVVGAYLGRRVSVHYGRTHYAPDFALLIGPTYDKKTTSQRRAVDFASRLSPPVATLAALASAEGLTEWLARQDMTPEELLRYSLWEANPDQTWTPLHPEHRRGLANIEEFASVLMKARMEGASQLIATITQLYDMPAILAPPLRGRRIMAEAPTLSILGGSTVEWLVHNLHADEVAGGFGNRFGYFTGNPKAPIAWPAKPDEALLDDLAAQVQAAYNTWRPRTEFVLTDTAQRAWGAFYSKWTAEARRDGELPTSQLESRVPEHTIKLALVYAALGSDKPVISDQHIEAAVAVGWYLRESVRFALGERLDTGESPLAKLERRVLALLAGGPAKRRELQQRSKQRGTTAADFARVYKGLVDSRLVTEDSATGLVRLAR